MQQSWLDNVAKCDFDYNSERESLSRQSADLFETKREMYAYAAIFQIPSKDFALRGVKYLGQELLWHHGGNPSHHFLALLEVPSDLLYDVYPPADVFKKMRGWMERRFGDKFGQEVLYDVKWKAVSKWGRKRNKHFHFIVRISPAAILGFDLVGGKYRIIADCYGMFY